MDDERERGSAPCVPTSSPILEATSAVGGQLNEKVEGGFVAWTCGYMATINMDVIPHTPSQLIRNIAPTKSRAAVAA